MMIDTSFLVAEYVLENIPVYDDPKTNSELLNDGIVLYFLTLSDIYKILLQKAVY